MSLLFVSLQSHGFYEGVRVTDGVSSVEDVGVCSRVFEFVAVDVVAFRIRMHLR